MVFSSNIFLFVFLPCVISLYFFADERYRNHVLLAGSLLFYAWGEPRYVLLMLLSITLNYAFGIMLGKTGRFRKAVLVLAVCYNLLMLIIFKYLNFLARVVNNVLHTGINIPQIALPIGISFFTFQIMSYVIDVYWGNVPAQKNPFHLALYISLFPQLIAGPIVRYIDVEKQIAHRTVSVDKAAAGFRRFMLGFSKKILLADQLAVLADIAFEGQNPSLFLNWAGIAAYTLQIYYDFSGYSDMAIGLGKIFGFDFLENFNYPYISRSVKEFWRRWHISLSTWFRDYLYIPLGGNRKGTARTYFNLLVVFFMTGFWHGASFNFIVWGLFYAVFLIAERLGLGRMLEKWPKVIQHIYTITIFMFGWVFFRAPGLKSAVNYIVHMFIPGGRDLANFTFVMNRKFWFILLLGICFAAPHERICKGMKARDGLAIAGTVFQFMIFILAVCYMVGSGFSPFLYFRF